MDYLISIIMPIYNAEQNLNETIQSIINQSIGFENLELILVDDASTDNSKKIIEYYCNEYSNIIPFYSKKSHGSPGFGRNMGLKIANSNYIMFIDNDDTYDQDICKKLYDAIKCENADIVCCNKISVDSISNIKQHIKYTNGIQHEDYVILKDDDIILFDSVAVWNKIYKKEIIQKNDLKFKEKTRADDFAFTIDYYLNCKKLIYLKDYYGYNWNIKSDSLSHTITKKHIHELIYTYTYTYYQLKSKNKEKYMDSLIKSHVSYLILQCSYLNSGKNEFEKILEEVYAFEKEINFNAKLDQLWAEIINRFIKNKNFFLAMTCLKILDKIRKFTFLRKISRKFKEK